MGGPTDLAWTRDISALGVLGVVLAITFFVLFPKIIDFVTNVASKKFDQIIELLYFIKRIAIRTYKTTKHLLRHVHDLLRLQGVECPHGDDDTDDDELLDEDDSHGIGT